jgi:hypothetical protein
MRRNAFFLRLNEKSTPIREFRQTLATCRVHSSEVRKPELDKNRERKKEKKKTTSRKERRNHFKIMISNK